MDRRGFLGLLGAAPLVGPLAAKSMAAKASADLAGVSTSGLVPSLEAPCSPGNGLIEARKRLAFLKAFGIPSPMKESIEKQARRVTALDPDLAANRSMSLSMKMHLQYKRNRKVLFARPESDAVGEIVKHELQEKTGLWWWW